MIATWIGNAALIAAFVLALIWFGYLIWRAMVGGEDETWNTYRRF